MTKIVKKAIMKAPQTCTARNVPNVPVSSAVAGGRYPHSPSKIDHSGSLMTIPNGRRTQSVTLALFTHLREVASAALTFEVGPHVLTASHARHDVACFY